MPELVSSLATLARRRIVSGGVEVSRALNDVLDEAVEAEPNGVLAAQEPRLRAELAQQLSAYGPIQPLLDDPDIE